jgi:hypothetical protein
MARQVTGWLTRHPATLTEDDQVRLKAVLEHCPELCSLLLAVLGGLGGVAIGAAVTAGYAASRGWQAAEGLRSQATRV